MSTTEQDTSLHNPFLPQNLNVGLTCAQRAGVGLAGIAGAGGIVLSSLNSLPPNPSLEQSLFLGGAATTFGVIIGGFTYNILQLHNEVAPVQRMG